MTERSEVYLYLLGGGPVLRLSKGWAGIYLGWEIGTQCAYFLSNDSQVQLSLRRERIEWWK